MPAAEAADADKERAPAAAMMVAAITAMPPPCGVGSVCEERALGLASAMRCSHGRIATMIATRSRPPATKATIAAIASKLAAPWPMRSLTAKALLRQICLLRSDFPRPHGDDQSEIVEEGLPIDAGIEKADLPAEEAALARRAEQIEQRAVLRRHVRPERLERRHVHVAPALEAAAREHVKPADAVAQPGIGADDVFAVHAVADLRNLIVIDLAAGAAGQEVRPPIVRGNLGRAAADHQQPARGLVEHDGVAAGDALHQRVVEARLAAIGARVAAGAAFVVDEHGARAIHRRDMRRPARQAFDGARELVGLPDVVLVAIGVIVEGERRIAGEAEEVLDEALPRSVADVDRGGAEPVLVFRHDRQGVVAGAVVGDEQPPIGEALIGEGRKLSGEEPCTVIRTQQYGDTRHNDDDVRRLRVPSPLACLARR